MELQMKKSSVELELFEVNLRDYEPDPSFDHSLAQLLWCEKNLKESLHRLNDKKIQRDVSFNNGGNDQLYWGSRNLNSSQHRSQLNPWISPNYRSSKVGETTMVQELIIGDQNRGNGALGVADNYMCNNNNQLPIIGFQSIQQSGIPLLAPQPSFSTTYTTTYPQILQPTDHTSNQNMNMNMSMNMNANPPLRSTISQLECEDFLNPNYIEGDTNEKQHAPADPTRIITNSIPPSDPDVELLLPNCNISLEDLMGNDAGKVTSSVAGNQEDDYSLEWDGFVLAENLINLDDHDIF
ncbi:hypothetical protein FNV43_RR19306 [Rhamnella rubrinervis]|uniref:Uncharacterized protein n=1 Tax=Rhamnella rubrinervis TaxID=2594499 RepID=A0A8K0E0X8_9ROSA|nr:hypothetical protein FNV43_RR19306 [Rhamnella rubrinervis]